MENKQLSNTLQTLAEEAVCLNNSQKLPITANVNTASFSLADNSIVFSFTSKHAPQTDVRFNIDELVIGTTCSAAPTNQLLYTLHAASLLIEAIKTIYKHPDCDECAERLWHVTSFSNSLCCKNESNETYTIQFDFAPILDLTSK